MGAVSTVENIVLNLKSGVKKASTLLAEELSTLEKEFGSDWKAKLGLTEAETKEN